VEYLNALHTKPILTKCVTASLLMCVGDAFAQGLIEKKETFDWRRTSRMGIIGLCVSGPLLSGWFGILDKFLPGSSLPITFLKLCGDQALFAPVIISAFFVSNELLDGKPIKSAKSKLDMDLWPTIKANWTVWPIASFINFRFVPPSQRVLYTSCITLFWNSYLSYVGNRQTTEK